MTFAAQLLDVVTDPFAEPITQRAFAEVVLLGIIGAALGAWVVFYELSYGAESLAHGLFPGLVVSALTGLPLVVGGAAGLLVAAAAIALARRIPEISGDTAIAIAVTSLFGLGVLLALSPTSPPGIQTLLFGDILGVSDGDLAFAAAAAVATLAALRVMHGRLLVVGFDRPNARAFGANPRLADLALLVLLALAILAGVQGLGSLLVVAVLIAPASTARLLVRRIVPMMALGACLALVAGVAGIYLSYYARTAAGASIAGAMVTEYLLALGATAWSRRHVLPAGT